MVLLLVSDSLIMSRVKRIEYELQNGAAKGMTAEEVIAFLEEREIDYFTIGRAGDTYGHKSVSDLAGIPVQSIRNQIRATVTVYRPMILGDIAVEAYYIIDTNGRLMKCHINRRNIML
jgi:hypothetical protein